MAKFTGVHELFPIETKQLDEFILSEFRKHECLRKLVIDGLPEHELRIAVCQDERCPLQHFVDMLVNSNVDEQGTSATELLSLYLTAPDSILDFDQIRIDALGGLLDRLNEYITAKDGKTRKTRLLKLVKVLIPLFLRCPLQETFSEIYTRFYSFVFGIIGKHAIMRAMDVMIILNTIRVNIKDCGLVSRLLKNAVDITKELYEDEEVCNLTVPWVASKVADILVIATPILLHYEHRWKHVAPLYLFSLQTVSHVLINLAVMYPPCLSHIPLNSFAKYFMRWPTGYSECYPCYEYVQEHANIVDGCVLCVNVKALVNIFALMSCLCRKDLEETSKDLCLGAIVSMCHESRFAARAAARCLMNVARYNRFHPLFEEFKKRLSSGCTTSVNLFIQMSAYNFSDEFNRFERKHQLSKLAQTVSGSIQEREMHRLNLLITPERTSEQSIFDITRVLDGLLCQDDIHIAAFVHENDYVSFLAEYLILMMKNGVPILDMRFAHPFAHLARCYVELVVKMRPQEYKDMCVGVNTDLILQLYRNILLCCKPLNDAKQTTSTITVDVYGERKRIAALVRPLGLRFVKMCAMRVEHFHVSLLVPFIFLLADMMTIEPYICDMNTIIEFISKFLPHLLRSSSKFVFQALEVVLINICDATATDAKGCFLDLISDVFQRGFETIDMKNDACNKLNQCIRILIMMSRATAHPKFKMCMLMDSNLNGFIELLLGCVTPRVADISEVLTVVACECLMHIICPSITTNQCVDLRARVFTESMDLDVLKKTADRLCKMLDFRNSGSNRAMAAAIRCLCYACKSPLFMTEFRKIPFTLRIQDLQKSGLWDDEEICEDFLDWVFELYFQIADTDNVWGQKMCGCDIDSSILYKCGTGNWEEAIKLIEKLQEKKVAPHEELQFSRVKACYQKRASVCYEMKLKTAYPPMPDGWSWQYLDIEAELDSFFSDAQSLHAQKR